MQKPRGCPKSTAITSNISVVATNGNHRPALVKNVSLLFEDVLEKLKKGKDSQEAEELIKWLSEGPIDMKINGKPCKKPLRGTYGFINVTQTEHYKNGLVIYILSSNDLYFPCNLGASFSSGAKELLKLLLSLPSSSAGSTDLRGPTVDKVGSILEKSLFYTPPAGDQLHPFNNSDTQIPVGNDNRVPIVGIGPSPSVALPPPTSTDYKDTLLNLTTPLPENVFIRIVRAIFSNTTLETINREKGYYFIPDVAIRVILADGTLYGLGNEFLTETRIMEVLPLNFSAVRGSFRQNLRINNSQLDAKKSDPNINQEIIAILETFMAGNFPTQTEKGTSITLVNYQPDELGAVKELLPVNDGNLKRFYGAINTGDSRTNRTITKGFFIHVPQDFSLPIPGEMNFIEGKTDMEIREELVRLKQEKANLNVLIQSLEQEYRAIEDQISQLSKNTNDVRFEDFYADNPNAILNGVRELGRFPEKPKFDSIPELMEVLITNVRDIINRYNAYNKAKQEFTESRKKVEELNLRIGTLKTDKLTIEQRLDTELNKLDQLNKTIQMCVDTIKSRINALSALLEA